MPNRLRILMLEDNADDAEMVCRILSKEKADFEFNLVMDKDQFLHALDHFDPGIILADNSLPQFSALEALDIVHKRIPDLPFIMVTGSVSEEFAADIIKLGADDYILKDRMVRLPAAIDTAIEKQRVGKERRDALEELRKSEERFQMLSRATKDAIWDWDLVTNEVWWNENFYRLLGYDSKLPVPEQLEWIKRIHHADRSKVMARLKGVLSYSIPSWEDEFRVRLPNGSYGTVLDRAYVIKDPSGKPIRVIGALVDISEQKLLVREMEILSLFARESQNSVMIFNYQSNEVSWVNAGFSRCTGYTLPDLVNRDPWLLMEGGETNKETPAYIGRQIKANRPFNCDLLIYTKQAGNKWLSVSGQPIRGRDYEAGNYFVMASDISERQKMEEERLANKMDRQKEVTRVILETQEKERNALGRELHDNINQILAAVNLKLGYYLEEPGNNLDIIQHCRLDLQRAIEETRNLSHHMVMPRFSDINLRDELELLFEDFIIDKTVQFHFEIANESKIPSPIKETLFRIVQEQLNNINKHARATEIDVCLNADLCQATMEIRDNGVGFDTHQRGKGIGITNIYNRVESYNGCVDILSTPGNGCTLTLKIPFQERWG